MCKFKDHVVKLEDLGKYLYCLKTHSRKLEENKIAVNSTKTIGGTSLIVSKTFAADAMVGNELGDDKERIVRVVVDNSCREGKGRKEGGNTDRRKVLDK